MAQEFFASDVVKRAISGVLRELDGNEDAQFKHVCKVLFIIQKNAASFDERCQINIQWIGTSIGSDLERIAAGGMTKPDVIADLTSMLFRVVCEFELSTPDDLSIELRSFLSWVHDNASQLGKDASRQVDFARHQMPVTILKALLGTDVVRNLPNIQEYAAGLTKRRVEWDEDLASREARVEKLRDALSRHESGFNFVGLHKGFDDLSTVKKNEVWWLRLYVLLLGVGAVLPLSLELLLLFWYRAELTNLSLPLLLSVLPAVSVTVILIYYFRLAVRSHESSKAQLSQIELRKTMCRFVESYADFAKRMKADNAETLSKFEAMIFSNIVGSDERLPATFDGVEQLSALIKSIKS